MRVTKVVNRCDVCVCCALLCSQCLSRHAHKQGCKPPSFCGFQGGFESSADWLGLSPVAVRPGAGRDSPWNPPAGENLINLISII
ncbi:hypothetical protein M440DRAFT_1197791 [Trichoderma longibrachiatum ATCC 18648]|uniref:Uncharacterized protein n=1 Tax=Trichoderma longibrachiatum ATCC 18648 TaxID=983965 RepID=A0A2T4CAM3_TRILO|nr:hypothetical protein M440DRAFT_1197791 [Trichoderma longibrachiatum ATCC 18648]